MANAIIAKLAVGFASLGAVFSMGFLSPEASNKVQLTSAIAPITQPTSSYITIAKAPVATGLKINQTHIFQGEINRKGLAVGYHHRSNGKDSSNARLTKITGLPNSKGVYVGRVEIRNPTTGQWVSKLSSSSFFPDRFSQSQVVNEITAAFKTVNPPKEFWRGTSPSGLIIEGYYSKATNTISTAYPVYRK